MEFPFGGGSLRPNDETPKVNPPLSGNRAPDNNIQTPSNQRKRRGRDRTKSKIPIRGRVPFSALTTDEMAVILKQEDEGIQRWRAAADEARRIYNLKVKHPHLFPHEDHKPLAEWRAKNQQDFGHLVHYRDVDRRQQAGTFLMGYYSGFVSPTMTVTLPEPGTADELMRLTYRQEDAHVNARAEAGPGPNSVGAADLPTSHAAHHPAPYPPPHLPPGNSLHLQDDTLLMDHEQAEGQQHRGEEHHRQRQHTQRHQQLLPRNQAGDQRHLAGLRERRDKTLRDLDLLNLQLQQHKQVQQRQQQHDQGPKNSKGYRQRQPPYLTSQYRSPQPPPASSALDQPTYLPQPHQPGADGWARHNRAPQQLQPQLAQVHGSPSPLQGFPLPTDRLSRVFHSPQEDDELMADVPEAAHLPPSSGDSGTQLLLPVVDAQLAAWHMPVVSDSSSNAPPMLPSLLPLNDYTSPSNTRHLAMQIPADPLSSAHRSLASSPAPIAASSRQDESALSQAGRPRGSTLASSALGYSSPVAQLSPMGYRTPANVGSATRSPSPHVSQGGSRSIRERSASGAAHSQARMQRSVPNLFLPPPRMVAEAPEPRGCQLSGDDLLLPAQPEIWPQQHNQPQPQYQRQGQHQPEQRPPPPLHTQADTTLLAPSGQALRTPTRPRTRSTAGTSGGAGDDARTGPSTPYGRSGRPRRPSLTAREAAKEERAAMATRVTMTATPALPNVPPLPPMPLEHMVAAGHIPITVSPAAELSVPAPIHGTATSAGLARPAVTPVSVPSSMPQGLTDTWSNQHNVARPFPTVPRPPLDFHDGTQQLADSFPQDSTLFAPGPSVAANAPAALVTPQNVVLSAGSLARRTAEPIQYCSNATTDPYSTPIRGTHDPDPAPRALPQTGVPGSMGGVHTVVDLPPLPAVLERLPPTVWDAVRSQLMVGAASPARHPGTAHLVANVNANADADAEAAAAGHMPTHLHLRGHAYALELGRSPGQAPPAQHQFTLPGTRQVSNESAGVRQLVGSDAGHDEVFGYGFGGGDFEALDAPEPSGDSHVA